MTKFEKENKEIRRKDKWEYCDVILLLLMLGVNHRLPLLHMSIFLFLLVQQKNVLINLQLEI